MSTQIRVSATRIREKITFEMGMRLWSITSDQYNEIASLAQVIPGVAFTGFITVKQAAALQDVLGTPELIKE
jgi:hypothetical protein